MTVSRFRTTLYIVVAIVALAGLADAAYLTVQALTGESKFGNASNCKPDGSCNSLHFRFLTQRAQSSQRNLGRIFVV
jgi:hypothetical protein